MKWCFLIPLMVAGCVSPWARYDQSQYAVTMEPGVESYSAHAQFLQEWSDGQKDLPPGFAAELGFYLGLLGKQQEARAWFDVEVDRYPQSVAFVDALRSIVIPEARESHSQEVSE